MMSKIQAKYSALFLDRDGVINRRIIDDYVKTCEDFHFIAGVPESIALLNRFFKRTLVVTNQQGVGKNLMTGEQLQQIHDYMCKGVEHAGGKIDAVYFSPALKRDNALSRKPNIGMGLQAKKEFPEIDFKNSWMVGDSLTDLEFGKRLGMKTVFIAADPKTVAENDHLIDFAFDSLVDFAEAFPF